MFGGSPNDVINARVELGVFESFGADAGISSLGRAVFEMKLNFRFWLTIFLWSAIYRANIANAKEIRHWKSEQTRINKIIVKCCLNKISDFLQFIIIST